MRALHPAQSFHEVEIILRLILVSRRSGTQLKSGGAELREFVDGVGDVVGGAIDAQIGCSDGRDVQQAVIDANITKRNSFTIVGENKWVSLTLKKRPVTGRS